MYGRTPTIGEINQVIENALDKVAAEGKAILEDITKGWKNRPEFTIIKGQLTRDIVTDSDIFIYVDLGTRPHEIRPRTAKALVFRVGGTAKTQPNILGSGSGAKGNTLVRAQVVHHPGNEARNFTANLSVLMDKRLEQVAEQDLTALIVRLADEAIVLS